MLLERYYDDSLAQASYLIGCERAREAIVIDPNRDAARYLAAARARTMTLRYVAETHIHADFLSGARDLARAAGAQLLLSAHGGNDWSYGFASAEGARLLRDGDTIAVGDIRIQVVHAPGHTPEHICFLVTDTATGGAPIGLISGDFVFVGDVGRPDLLERAAGVAGTMEASARELYASLQRLREYPDYLQIWPGHGAGSACGKSLGAMPQSTLGYERLYNPAFQQPTEDAFVSWVLADQPEPPPYFAVMKRLNRDGPPPRPRDPAPRQMDVAALIAALDGEHQVVDLRGSADYAQRHLQGTINIPASKSTPTYAGTVLSYDRPILLVARSEMQAVDVAVQLALIGLDRVEGWVPVETLDDVAARGRALTPMPIVDASTVAERLSSNGVTVIDVRKRNEWNEGHIEGAEHIYLGDLAERAAELPHDAPIVVHCQSGSRASIAASLLRARGFTNVSSFSAGMKGWIKAGLPVEK